MAENGVQLLAVVLVGKMAFFRHVTRKQIQGIVFLWGPKHFRNPTTAQPPLFRTTILSVSGSATCAAARHLPLGRFEM